MISIKIHPSAANKADDMATVLAFGNLKKLKSSFSLPALRSASIGRASSQKIFALAPLRCSVNDT
jgi:hypothetical protein